MTPAGHLVESPSALARTAHHEAGHAVAAVLLGLSIRRATIVPGRDSHGHVRHRPRPRGVRPEIKMTPSTRCWLENRIVCSLAGAEAEFLAPGARGKSLRGARPDRETAARLASTIGGDGEGVAIFLRWCRHRARALVRAHAKRIRRVAAALLEKRTLSAREVREAMCTSLPRLRSIELARSRGREPHG